MTWIISGKHIAARIGNEIAHLNAIDVHDALADPHYSVLGKELDYIQDCFKDLSFSSIGKHASIALCSSDKNIMIEIKIGDALADFVSGEIIDQIIIDNRWFFIDNADEINQILRGAEIKNNGPIRVGQYISILRNGANKVDIDNRVSSKSLQDGLKYIRPAGLNAELFEYQKNGYTWMCSVLDGSSGCILGDEMGLGKTLQAIALMQRYKNEGKKSLVIAPVSLLENWKNECKKFAPNLNVLIHHGQTRTGFPKVLLMYDVVVTSYSNAVSDASLLNLVEWELISLDEAQNIKNPRSQRTKHIKELKSNKRLAITGTPFENHVLDVWSIVDFVIPGSLGTENTFLSEISDDIYGANKLEPILSSIMIRRLVKDVAEELPEKIIVPQPISMDSVESEVYEEMRDTLSGTKNYSLPLLMKLREYCAHPNIIEQSDSDDPAKHSLKYQRCCEIIEEIISRKEKVLIFSSFVTMLHIFEEDLKKRFDVPVAMIYGETKDRQDLVDWFNGVDGSAILLLNPKAAGVGLNITGANHIIHYTLEWNPAVEDQASARAYRKGQTKTTFIYRLFYKDTVEDIMNQRLERKREMANAAVVGADGTVSDMNDLIKAFNISPRKV